MARTPTKRCPKVRPRRGSRCQSEPIWRFAGGTLVGPQAGAGRGYCCPQKDTAAGANHAQYETARNRARHTPAERFYNFAPGGADRCTAKRAHCCSLFDAR